MATSSVYSDWITYPEGATRLSRLRLFIKDLSDQLVAMTQQFAIPGREVNPELTDIRAELQDLRKEEKLLAERLGLSDGTFQGWTSGRARL